MELRPLNDKRGITISTPTVIITILSVLVLLVVALSFTGGMRALVDQIKRVFGVTSESPLELARDKCETYCSLSRTDAYCNGVDILIRGEETENFDCFNIAPCPGVDRSACS